MERIPELDGLRGIAAVGVVMFHWVPKHTFWMWSFVDLFLVLSGFLISGIILDAVAQNKFSLRNFWIRRILRIWPVYYAVMAGVLGLLLIIGKPLASYKQDVALSLAFVQFVPFYWIESNTPADFLQFLPGFIHSWSLAVEEQFYVVWPLILLLFWRLGLRSQGLIQVLFTLLIVAYWVRASGEYPPILLLTRMDGLLLGALLAILVRGRFGLRLQEYGNPHPYLALLGAASCVGAAIIAPYLLAGYQGNDVRMHVITHPELISGFGMVYFGIVGMVVFSSGRPIVAFLALPFMSYLGRISYTLYMSHMPILQLIKPELQKHYGELPTSLHTLLLGILIWGSAHLLCKYLEQPILSLKDRLPNLGAEISAREKPPANSAAIPEELGSAR